MSERVLAAKEEDEGGEEESSRLRGENASSGVMTPASRREKTSLEGCCCRERSGASRCDIREPFPRREGRLQGYQKTSVWVKRVWAAP